MPTLKSQTAFFFEILLPIHHSTCIGTVRACSPNSHCHQRMNYHKELEGCWLIMWEFLFVQVSTWWKWGRMRLLCAPESRPTDGTSSLFFRLCLHCLVCNCLMSVTHCNVTWGSAVCAFLVWGIGLSLVIHRLYTLSIIKQHLSVFLSFVWRQNGGL